MPDRKIGHPLRVITTSGEIVAAELIGEEGISIINQRKEYITGTARQFKGAP